MRRFAMRLLLSMWVVVTCAQVAWVRPAAGSAAPPEHLAVLFILDDSGSMQGNDPSNRRYAAAALFIAALDEGDRAGVLGFASTSRPITNGMVEIAGQLSKADLIAMLQPVPADGYTDVKAAFEAAQAMMESAAAEGYHTVVIFLTDGRPEVPGMTAGYPEEALSAARALGVPIYAVALTAQGQTAFLDQVATGTGGKVVPAAQADDLLDSFLSILGELKDRTILGQDGGAITIDARLAPYIDTLTLIAVHPQADGVQLVGPDGAPVLDGGAVITLPGDLRITPVTVAAPAPGEWRFTQAGGQAGQVRAILHARLRAKVTAPVGLVEAGSPVTVTAELLEEQQDGSMVKIVGDASFSALITLPDGRQESLDVLYDDGTHSDVSAGDGTFSRLFANTITPGEYRVQIQGRKGQIPVEASAVFQAVALPDLAVIEPGLPRYELRGEAIPLEIRLAAEAVETFEGGFIASITMPDGSQIHLALDQHGSIFTGQFVPVEDGNYQVTFLPQEAAYQGIAYRRSAQANFEVQIVPVVALTSARLMSVSRYEAGETIPVEVTLHSTSRRIETLRVLAQGAQGFTIREAMPFQVPPGESKIILHLVAEPGAVPGDRQVDLRLLPDGDSQALVDIHNKASALEFSIFEPSITWTVEEIAGCTPERCWQPCPVRILLRASSTSTRAEPVTLRLEGLDNASLSRAKFEIPPGLSETVLEVQSPSALRPGSYTARLVLQGARPGLSLQPGLALPVEFTVPSPLRECRIPLILSGSGLVALAIIGIKVRRAVQAKTQPPLVKGTLTHWRSDVPGRAAVVDLTAMQQEEVTLGSGPQCDIVIEDAGLEEAHARISAERDADGQVRWMMTPLGRVTAGYRVQAAPFELQEKITYQMGEQVFTFLRDAEI